jgi:hypothetical protein
MAQRDDGTGKLFEHITIPTTRTATIGRTPDEGRRDVSSTGWSFARRLSFMAALVGISPEASTHSSERRWREAGECSAVQVKRVLEPLHSQEWGWG